MSESKQPTAEPGVEGDDIGATTIVVVGLISTALVLASVLGVTALYDATVGSFQEERLVGVKYSETEDILTQHDNTLNGSPKVIDAEKGTYRIPIDLAMKLVVSEMSEKEEDAKQGAGSEKTNTEKTEG